MSRSLATIRRVSMAVAVVFVSHGAVAADPSEQRLAMARPQAAEVPAHQPEARASRPATPSREVAAAKTARRSPERASVTPSSDGSRFLYDSCGCSND